ncbi:hypothetical protein PR048_010017 [Dryococelus australis]|uniref:Uncharacterized protein n=1 Tax=Dryococelus australis TaxID=614101 RepID=A0ABQ9I1J3_9NEOP|nr:hypothetical protein PR048_010017 [Dryococelus australis]
MQLVSGFSRGSPVSPSFHSGAAPYSPHFTLTGSQYLDCGRPAHNRLRLVSIVEDRYNHAKFHRRWRRLLETSYQLYGGRWLRARPTEPNFVGKFEVNNYYNTKWEPPPIRRSVRVKRYTVGKTIRVAMASAYGERSAGFSRDLPFPSPLHSGPAPYSPHFTVIGSQDLAFKSQAVVVQRSDYSPPPRQTGFDSRRGRSRIFASGNRARLSSWLVGFLGDLPFPPPLHSGAAPYSPHFTLIDSQDLDDKRVAQISSLLN